MSRTTLPWMQWFPADHLGDRQLRACERGTRSDWVDMCSVMWERRESHLRGTPAQIARTIGVTPEEMANTIADLYAHGAADVAPAPERIVDSVACVVSPGVTYTVTSRRLKRMLNARVAAAKRQEKFRNGRRDANCNADGNAHNNGQGDLPLMDTVRNADGNARGNALSDASASDLSEALEDQTQISSLSRAHARWTKDRFAEAWGRLTNKTTMCAPEIRQQAADLCAESATRLGRDVVAHAEALIAAFPQLVGWYRQSGWVAPLVSIPAFVKPEHFGRCEEVVTGELDLSVPMRGDRTPTGTDPKRGQLAVATAVEEDDAPTGAIIKNRK